MQRTANGGPRTSQGWWPLRAGAAWLVLVACGAAGASGLEGPGSGAAAVQRRVESGPLVVTVELDRETMTVADRLTVTLRAHGAGGAGCVPVLPEVGEKLGSFTVVWHGLGAPTLAADGGLVAEGRYVLEPFLAGEYEVPGFEVRCGEGRAGKAVRTEPVKVKVTSLLEGDQPKLETGPIRDVVAPPRAPSMAVWTAVGIAGGLGLASVAGRAILLRRRGGGVAEDRVARAARRLRALHIELHGGTTRPAATVCDEVARALRACLAGACDPRAEGMTGEEIGAAATEWPAARGQAAELRGVLGSCDAARFGGEEMGAATLRDLVGRAVAVAEGLAAGRDAAQGVRR